MVMGLYSSAPVPPSPLWCGWWWVVVYPPPPVVWVVWVVVDSVSVYVNAYVYLYEYVCVYVTT